MYIYTWNMRNINVYILLLLLLAKKLTFQKQIVKSLHKQHKILTRIQMNTIVMAALAPGVTHINFVYIWKRISGLNIPFFITNYCFIRLPPTLHLHLASLRLAVRRKSLISWICLGCKVYKRVSCRQRQSSKTVFWVQPHETYHFSNFDAFYALRTKRISVNWEFVVRTPLHLTLLFKS